MARHDVVAGLAADVRIVEHRLEELAEVRRLFQAYATDLRWVADRASGTRPDAAVRAPDIRTFLALADEKRRAFKNRLAAFNQNAPARIDFRSLINPNLRTEPESILQLMAVRPRPGITVIGSTAVVSRITLEAVIAEAEDYFDQAEHELKMDLAAKQAHRDAQVPVAAATGEPSFSLVVGLTGALLVKWGRRLRRFPPIRLFIWAFEDRLKTSISALVIGGLVWLWTALRR